MSTSNFNEQLLDLQGVIITNIVQKEEITEIFLEHKGHADRCPHCGTICGNIHDYRKQRIKDIPAFGKSIVLVLRKRRFHCHHCGKNFYQNIPWLPKYSRMTNRFSAYVISLKEPMVLMNSKEMPGEKSISVSSQILRTTWF